MKKRTLLLTFEDLGLGGIQTKLIDIANALTKHSQNNVIIYLKRRALFDRSSLLHKNVKVVYCPNVFPRFIKARYYYGLLFLVLMVQPNVIFVSLEKQSLFILYWQQLLDLPLKVVVNIDTYLKMHQSADKATLSGILNLFGRTINFLRAKQLTFSPKLFNSADTVIAVSRAVYTDLHSRVRISAPPLVLLPNWTLLRSRSLKTYQERSEDLVYLGRLATQKRPKLIVDFMKQLVEVNNLVKLSVYGAGPLKKSFEQSIRKAVLDKNITVSEPLHTTSQVLTTTRFILLTSKYEGLPFVILEAMSLGCVVLALEAPGVTELVIDQKTGICKKTVAELVQEYVRLSHDAAAYSWLQENARLHQRQFYGKSNLNKIIEVMES